MCAAWLRDGSAAAGHHAGSGPADLGRSPTRLVGSLIEYIARRLWRLFFAGVVCFFLSGLASASTLQFANVWADPQASQSRLQKALHEHRMLGAAGGWPRVAPGPRLQAGATGERVRTLRLRLGLADGTLFDEGAEVAVRAFQERHGLTPDGVVGSATLLELNIPVEDRVAQMELALERFARLPPLGTSYVIVNAAAMLLTAVDHGAPVLEMRVVVGRPDWPTPLFSSRLASVTFSPAWTVPQRIAAQEVRPRALRDSGYLARNRIEIIDVEGGSLGYDLRAALATGLPYIFRQRPGDDNALGRVRFAAPNPYDVFLHGTPAVKLFDRPSRAFSHGCVRLERPIELARWLLADQPRWDDAAIAAATAREIPLVVRVTRDVMLHIIYMTAWADSLGSVHFRPDIYGADAEFRRAIAASARSSGDCRAPLAPPRGAG